VEAVAASMMVARELELLTEARAHMPRLPLDEIDVLIVDEIGKDVSGIGMDSNVVGRYYNGPTGHPPLVQRIIVRGLTARSDGNASGIGLADVVLRRAVERIDPDATWMNAITARTAEGARVGIAVETDREAIEVALACCRRVTPDGARIVRIRITAQLDVLYLSTRALAADRDSERLAVVRPAMPIALDAAGMLADDWDVTPTIPKAS
jgi:hypothetical protein